MNDFNIEPNSEQLDSVCFSVNHSYGLMSLMEQKQLQFEAKQYWRAIWKTLNPK
jgi:hypothetical protein